MDFKEFFILKESNSQTAAIVVDIQPLYDKHCRFIMKRFAQFVNDFKGPIVCFYNGPDIGGDEEYQVKEYFLEHEITEEKLEEILFKEKMYAFFRNWMDRGVDRKQIIQAIRYMVITRKYDSRDVTDDEWKKVFGEDVWEDDTGDLQTIVTDDDCINMPDINIAQLKQYSGCYLMGGGKDECLSEFRLILEAFNIKYKLIDSLIY